MEEQIKISNGTVSAVISTLGAELKSVVKDGKEILWEGDPAVWKGQAPLLFPICGQLRDGKYIYEGKEYQMGGHGFAKNSEFMVENADDLSATFTLCSSEETLKTYPFQFELRVTYTLIENAIEIKYLVSNKGKKKMHFSIGAHEGYACPEGVEAYSLVFEHPENLVYNNLKIPLLDYKQFTFGENIQELPLKYEYFAVDTLSFLELKSRKVSLKNITTGEVKATVDFNSFPYLFVWTENDAKFICIEPWNGMPDFFDSDYDFANKKGSKTLDVGESFECRHSITL